MRDPTVLFWVQIRHMRDSAILGPYRVPSFSNSLPGRLKPTSSPLWDGEPDALCSGRLKAVILEPLQLLGCCCDVYAPNQLTLPSLSKTPFGVLLHMRRVAPNARS